MVRHLLFFFLIVPHSTFVHNLPPVFRVIFLVSRNRIIESKVKSIIKVLTYFASFFPPSLVLIAILEALSVILRNLW